MLSRFAANTNALRTAMRKAPLRTFSSAGSFHDGRGHTGMVPVDPSAQPDYDLADPPKTFSLDAFYADMDMVEMTDEQALQYMHFASKMAMVSFKDEAEMLSFKVDFSAALSFIGKLDDVDTKGVEPLGNVLEFYGGADEKLRTVEDFKLA